MNIKMSEDWKAHYPLVFSAFIGFGFYSIFPNLMGLFVGPLTQEFAWTRSQVMSGLAFSSITAMILSPFVGAFVDRYGPRKIALPGIVLTAIAVGMFGFTNGSTAQWYLFWLAQSFFVLLIKATVWATAISKSFTSGRSLAMAITMSGTAFAQIIVPPMTQFLIEELGWRQAFFVIGIFWGTLAFIPAFLFLEKKSLEIHVHFNEKHLPEYSNGKGLTLQQALRNTALIKIALATLIVMLTGIGILVNSVPILVESGLDSSRAAYFVSVFGVAGIIGKLTTGWLMGRYSGSKVGGYTLGITSFAFLCLMSSNNIPLILLGLFGIGYGAGTKLQICALLTSSYAGLLHYGKIFGVMSSVIAISGGLGPLMASSIFDLTGSYDMFIYMSFGGAVVAGCMIYTLGPEPTEFFHSKNEMSL
jgi:predicted MFS family arabinose efflux permease